MGILTITSAGKLATEEVDIYQDRYAEAICLNVLLIKVL